MPLYIQNQNEVHNEDDRPLPANTPSTGSVFDNSHVVECGNRVLELIEKHKREVQLKMTTNEHGIRAMLEKQRATEGFQKHNTGPSESRPPPVENSRLRMSRGGGLVLEKSKIVQLYRDAVDNENKNTPSNSHMVRVALATEISKPNVEPKHVTLSEEYLQLPGDARSNQETGNDRDRALLNATINDHRDNDTESVFEPDEESEVEECLCNNDQDNANENCYLPSFKTRVQFQMPTHPNNVIVQQARNIGNDNDGVFDDEPRSTFTSSHQVLPNNTNSAAGTSKGSESSVKTQQTYSKRDILSKQSSRNSRKSNVTSMTDDGNQPPPSEHDLSTATSVSMTTTASKSNGAESGALTEKQQLICIVVAIIVVLLGILLYFMSKKSSTGVGGSAEGKYESKTKSEYYGPVM